MQFDAVEAGFAGPDGGVCEQAGQNPGQFGYMG